MAAVSTNGHMGSTRANSDPLLGSIGKTTLVKVLMGLYDHTGDLLINGHPAEAFPSKQLHAHTTCCFQDHAKYRLTLRENIGVGNVDLMDSEVDINQAIVRGGAEAVRDMLGLDGRLNDSGVPETGSIVAADHDPNSVKTGLAEKRPGSTSLRFRGAVRGRPGVKGEPIGTATVGHRKAPGLQRTSLSGGQWQRVALARAFMRADESDLVVFE